MLPDGLWEKGRGPRAREVQENRREESGGALKRPAQTLSIVRGTCTEAKGVQESMWTCLWPPTTQHLPGCLLHIPPLLSLSPPAAHHVLFPSSSTSESPSIGFSPQNNIAYSHLDTAYLSADRSNRELYGLKQDVNEYNFFSEDSVARRDGTFTPLGLTSMGETQQSSDQHLITNFTIALASEEDKVVESEEDCRKPGSFNCFFNEWPQRSKGAWISLEENESKRVSYSNTRLSISSSQYHNGLMLST